MMWQLPPLMKLAGHAACRPYATDFCQHGAAWRKRTRVMSWHCVRIPRFEQLCAGRGGLCYHTGKHHIILAGSDPVTHKCYTVVTQPYPSKFASACADLLAYSCEQLHMSRLTQL
eukprot:3803493-Heterocapsa_arctica.AAC.1